jgi:carbon-monoxide dehydrogenase medium subunit
VRIPAAPAGQGWAWEEVANRRGDFAMAGVGALVHLAGGRATQVRLAVAGMQSPAVRLAAVEQALVGSALDAAAIVQAGRAAREAVQPGDSYHADALYKRELVDTLVQRALQAARARAR